MDAKQIIQDLIVFNIASLRFVLNTKKFDLRIPSIILFALFLILDLLYNFRIITKVLDDTNNITSPKNGSFEKISVFEHFLSDERMTQLILRLSVYTIMRLICSFCMTYACYHIVSIWMPFINFQN